MDHHRRPKIYGISPLGERGQIVIPAKMREDLGLKKGENFVFVNKGHFIGLVRESDITGMLRDMLDEIEDFKKDI